MAGMSCGFNRSMQHLISNYREEDVGYEVSTEDLLHRRTKSIDVADSGGLLDPGNSVTVEVSANGGAKQVSVAAMLIPTNDAFFALNGVNAPKGDKTIVYRSPAYDAGSH